ncbi:MAG TPA: hypothetical protein VF756_02710 [Thermoanaerobaculia bacterium]
MPTLNSFKDLLADWEKLLAAIRETPGGIPHIRDFQVELERAFEAARALKTRQLEHRAAAQRTTRQLNEAVALGRDTASRTRSYLKGCLGFRNEDLVRFGVKPSRKRRPHC